MDENEIFELLENADWNDIGHRLILFSIWLARKYGCSGNSALPGGKEPKDIAYEAIEKVLNGTRDWNPDKYPDLLIHLQWIVRSDMGHLFDSYKKASRMPDIDIQSYETSQGVTSIQKNPEEVLILKEQRAIEDHLKEELYKEVAGDDDLETVLLLIDDDVWKPKEIAEKMGKEVSEVYTLRRKLTRKGKKILLKQFN